MRSKAIKTMALLLTPGALVVVGCGGRVTAAGAGPGAGAALSIQAAASHIDTNGTTRYLATLGNGDAAQVKWSLAGGDPVAGAGTISANGVYTPPNFLTEDAVSVSVRAVPVEEGAGPDAEPRREASAEITVTPGFLQPLTPANLSVGPGATISISGSMTEVGGSGGIRFMLAGSPGGAGSEDSALGVLSGARCVRGSVRGPNAAYTVCSVTYTAPNSIAANTAVFVVGVVGGSAAGRGADQGTGRSWTRVLLNAQGISSNPVAHQARLAVPVLLGSSSGNNSDYDASQGQVADCCGGTLGALLQDASGNQYVLSNNHVLARSDQGIAGETVIQPGLIDNGCTPYGVGPGTTPVATLSGYPALSLAATNVDAAIARVTPGAVDARGTILELGARQSDGTLGAAAPGISSTSGRGETATLGMMVAKSGRTTGLTCAAVSAMHVDVVVDYFTDCAETSHALTKTFRNQIAVAGSSFSDAGDSGALEVDAANGEPVGLFFAGGTDTNGVEQAIANPVGDVLDELGSMTPGMSGQTSYSFVGVADHPVACLSYGGAKAADEVSGAGALSEAERERVELVLPVARALLGPVSGVARVGVVASRDHGGEGAIGIYLDDEAAVGAAVPAAIGGIPTVVMAVSGSNSLNREELAGAAQGRPGALSESLSRALAAKQRRVDGLLKANAAIFGVGVGQSLDNPSDAAVMLYVDRTKAGGALPESIDGQRVRVILMDRLHVTRSHGEPARRSGNCSAPIPDGVADGQGDGARDGAQGFFKESVELPR